MKIFSFSTEVLTVAATAVLAVMFFFLSINSLAQTESQSQLLSEDQAVEEVFRIGQARSQEARKTQRRVDQDADQTRDDFQDYRQTLKVIEGLRVYNERLEKQIASQERRIIEIEKGIRDAAIVQRQVPSVVSRMIDGLEEFIKLDVPFHSKEREDRILLLRVNQDRDNLSIAEKFRQVLEAYKIENEYGRKLDTYRDTVEINGKPREVNILRIGRLALMYQTTDGELSGVWDHRQQRWEELDRAQYRNAIRQGLRIARKQTAISLMKIPVPAAKAL